MHEPAYPPARAAAAIVEAFFARRVPPAEARESPEAAPAPDATAVSALVDAAFWASLRREEGRSPRISLAIVPPERAGQPLMFEHPLPLAPDPLARLAPAVERPGIHLGVWGEGNDLRIWGATRTLPQFCLVIEVVEPGLLVLKYRRGAEFEKFGNLAVLRGDEMRVVDEANGSMPGGPALLVALLGSERPIPWSDSGNALVQLATSMRGHGHGASLLVVPSGTDTWRESIVQPMAYAVSPPFSRLSRLMRRQDSAEGSDGEGMRRLVDAIAGLTAVDGAAIMTDRFELLTFGATIRRRKGHGPIEQVIVTEPVLGDVPAPVAAAQLGGTRHFSAAQFVHDQPDALAFVASQDGRFTVFAWSPSKAMVNAHRVEVLLF